MPGTQRVSDSSTNKTKISAVLELASKWREIKTKQNKTLNSKFSSRLECNKSYEERTR